MVKFRAIMWAKSLEAKMPGYTVNYNDLALKRHRARQERMQMKRKILGQGGSQNEGILSKVRQMNSYNPEAVAGELMAQMVISLFQIFFNVPYLCKLMANKSQCVAELEAQLQGRDLRLIYQPNARGEYPELFPLNVKGEVDDCAEPLDPVLDAHMINEQLIMANGYSVPPRTDMIGIIKDYCMGVQTAMDEYIETMLGSNAISEEARVRIHGMQPSQQSEQRDDPNLVNGLMNRQVVRQQNRL